MEKPLLLSSSDAAYMKRPAYIDELDDLFRRGDLDGLLCRCHGIIEQVDSQPTDAYPETAHMREELARAYYELGDFFAAADQFSAALEIHRQHGQAVSEHSVRCLGMIGRLALWTGRTAEAEAAFCEALTLLDHLAADCQSSRGFVLVDLAQMHTWEGEYDTAERLLLDAAQKYLRNVGNCPGRLAFVYLHLSRAYEGQNRIVAANKTMEKALRYFRLGVGMDDPNYAALLSSRGDLMRRQGHISLARESHLEALAILERVRPKGSLLTERVKYRLANLDEITPAA